MGTTLVVSESPSLSEYNRAKEALKEVIPRGADLPKAVRLGMNYEKYTFVTIAKVSKEHFI
jgi:hypothetical protein